MSKERKEPSVMNRTALELTLGAILASVQCGLVSHRAGLIQVRLAVQAFAPDFVEDLDARVAGLATELAARND